jgi:fructuronate reductase
MPVRLNEKTLPSLETAVKPNYARDSIDTGIVHLGVGAFHRAHQAVYTDELLATGDNRWGIVGASLRSGSVRDALAPQDCLYTVCTRSGGTNDPRVIGSIKDILVLPESGQLQKLTDLIANATTQVVTLTITEKGYCHDHQGSLDTNHLDIVHDLAHPNSPRSAAGVLALALKKRMKNGAGGLTVLSCDNLADNGGVTRHVVEAMAQHHSPEAARWLADHVSFPTSMVDRIVPHTGTSDIEAFELESGYLDKSLVVCEPYSQWVIENDFAGERPDWASVGALFVASTQPYEQAKLSLLNATHSALAYLGLLAGYDYVHQAIANPDLAGFVRVIMDSEITPTVNCPVGMDLDQYKTSILNRFANPDIAYRTAQVATDGSQKLPQRIFPTIEQQLGEQSLTPGLILVVAAWLQCYGGRADDAKVISITDPMADKIVALYNLFPDAGDLVRSIAKETDQFGVLANNELFLLELTKALAQLRSLGSLASVSSFLS